MAAQAGSTGSAVERFLEHPRWMLAALCAAQLVFWTLAPTLSNFAPPRDMVESYLWGHEWVIGTYKHPNLPGWLLEAGRVLTGAIGWPAYLTSQLLIVGTYVLTYLLGARMMGESGALAGTLLLTGLFYVAWPSTLMNHDVVQMPIWAGLVLILWLLTVSPRPWLWPLLGAVAALGLYAKLSLGIAIATGGLWILYDERLRRQLTSPWPWAGLAAFALIAYPLARWLIETDFQALGYANERTPTWAASPLAFLGGQVLVSLGVVALAVLAGLTGPGGRTPDEPPIRERHASGDAVLFLAAMLLVPNLLTGLIAWGTAAGTRGMWGTPMLSQLGLLVVAMAPQCLTAASLRRLVLIASALLLVLPLTYAADMLLMPRLTGKVRRPDWPQAEINRRLEAAWQRETGKPLRIVVGNFWAAGLTALRPGPMPSILTDGNFEITPWVTPERLKREGALVVWEQTSPSDPPPEALRRLLGERLIGTERFDWPFFTGAPPILIGYAIVPPA